MHAHHNHQYGFSSSHSFELNNTSWKNPKRVQSFFMPSDMPHQLQLTGNDSVLMVWLDPEFKLPHKTFSLSNIQFSLPELEKQIFPLLGQSLNCKLAEQIRNIIMGRNSTSFIVIDERITASINWITSHLSEQTITTEMLAQAIFLSPGRFMHLFSDQIGIPVRKYILWQRLRYALLLLAKGTSITEASIESGFSDSSHMNRTFNTMFGISPSKIFKNSRFVQVIGCWED